MSLPSLEPSLALASPEKLTGRPHPSPPPNHKPRKPRPQSLHLPGRQAPSGQAAESGARHSYSAQCATPLAHRVEAAERMSDEANFVFIKTKFVW